MQNDGMKGMAFSKHGASDVLRMMSFGIPVPHDGEALIRVEAASVNRLDITVRNGFPGLKVEMPHIPGADAAGRVVEVSGGNGSFSEGDRIVFNPGISCGICRECISGRASLCRDYRILGEHLNGTYAQFVAVPQRNLKKVPADYPSVKAAAAPLVYLTAWHALAGRAKVRFGERLLVTGGSGGVSSAAVQIGKLFNCHVAVTTRYAAKEEALLRAGADEVIVTGEGEGWAKRHIGRGGKLFDIVLDSVGSAVWKDSFRLLEKGGRFVNYGRTSGGQISTDLSFVFWKQLGILGSTMGDPEEFHTVMDLVFSGRLNPIVDRAFTLEEAPQAQDYMESGAHVGKIVLTV